MKVKTYPDSMINRSFLKKKKTKLVSEKVDKYVLLSLETWEVPPNQAYAQREWHLFVCLARYWPR